MKFHPLVLQCSLCINFVRDTGREIQRHTDIFQIKSNIFKRSSKRVNLVKTWSQDLIMTRVFEKTVQEHRLASYVYTNCSNIIFYSKLSFIKNFAFLVKVRGQGSQIWWGGGVHEKIVKTVKRILFKLQRTR